MVVNLVSLPMALARVVAFEGVSTARIEEMQREMREGEQPEGMPASEFIMLHDAGSENALAIVFFETEEDYRRGDELLNAIEQQMRHAIDLFYREISVAFEPLAAFCVTERKRYEPLVEQADALKESLGGLSRRLGV